MKIFIENNKVIPEKFQNIKIPGHIGKWSAIETYTTPECTYYLFEHDTYGDETNYIVARIVQEKIVDTYETYDDIETCLRDEGIITEAIDKSNNSSYRIELFSAAVKNKPWYRGKIFYDFDSIDDALDFIRRRFITPQSVTDLILKNDAKKQDGRLISTSAYDLRKGDLQMTDYTSF